MNKEEKERRYPEVIKYLGFAILYTVLISAVWYFMTGLIINDATKALEDKAKELEELKREIELRPIQDNQKLIDSLKLVISKQNGIIVEKDNYIKTLDKEAERLERRRLKLKKDYEQELKKHNQVDSFSGSFVNGNDSALFNN